MKVIKRQRAQTAIELAVFGAIIIFTLGTIVRSAVGRGNQQQAVLKATRMALTMSYITSDSNELASRNNAFVLIVEDRLTAASAKYGAVDRSPFITQGSGVHSSNLFMPVDFGDAEDIPVFDLFVNGKHFSFTTGAFKRVGIAPDTINVPPVCGGTTCYSIKCSNDPNSFDPCGLGPGGGGEVNCSNEHCLFQIPNCVGMMAVEYCADASPCPAECTDCSSTSLETYLVPISNLSCPMMFTIIDNHPLSTKWCTDETACSPPICTFSGLPEAPCSMRPFLRFIVDRWDTPISTFKDVPPDEWERFAWQWFLVVGYEEADDDEAPPANNLNGGGAALFTTQLLIGEGINVDASKNIDVDLDLDLKLERVLAFESQNRIIQSVDVRDLQEGDMDFSHSDSDEGPDPGLKRDVSIFTKVRPGTYLQIDEGKLFEGKQFIRTASKKDTIDTIQREFQLSNNTGRFCSESGVLSSRIGNPVEACNNCFSPGNAGRTCMDTEELIIYIRSSITDLRGHKWTTDVSSDPYINVRRN